MTEAACAPLARGEVGNDLELDLYHRNDDELSDPLTGLHREWFAASVPARDHELTLVVGVDETDEIAENDAMLVAEAGARKDHGRESGILQMNGETRRNQFGLAGRQLQGSIEAGAQIEPRRSLGRIRGQRQIASDPRIENAHLEGTTSGV